MDNTQETKEILSEKTVNYMNYCLYNAANNGTGGAALFGGQYIAGKTGTTSDNRDRWFCGYTTHYTAAVWVGYDQPERINVGTNPAAQLWRKVMQPIHEDLPAEGLYNGNAFHSVAVCLDSGMNASPACRSDVRGAARVVYVNVYNGDEPKGTCDKHVQVEYCVTGGGVATEYCSMFPDAQVESRSLVKLTPEEVQEIKDAANVGLNDVYLQDNYVYYMGNDGWHGFYGNANDGVDAPYIVCPLHNENTWMEQGGYEEETQFPDEGTGDGMDDGFFIPEDEFIGDG